MLSSNEALEQTRSIETIHRIIDRISSLHKRLSEAKCSILEGTSQNGTNGNEEENGIHKDKKLEKKLASSEQGLRGHFQWTAFKRKWSSKKKEEDKKKKKKNNNNYNNKSNSRSNHNNSNGYINHSDICDQFEKLCKELKYMARALEKLKKLEDELNETLKILEVTLEDINSVADGSSKKQQIHQLNKLCALRSKLIEIKIQIPIQIWHQTSTSYSQANWRSQKTVASKDDDDLPGLYMEELLEQNPCFEELNKRFESVDDPESLRSMLCLLSFAVFPENHDIKKRVLTYWWVGEEFVPEKENAEDFADKTLKDFVKMGFIKPVNDNRKPDSIANTFKLHPLVRAAVIKLAKDRGFFSYDDNPNMDFSRCKRACLVKPEEGSSSSSRLIQENDDPRKLQTLFNVSEKFPDFEVKWFSKMRDIRVLHLGKWEGTAERHIEVDGAEFLTGSKNFKNLRLLSFQGVSRIMELPSCIRKLKNLRILDLRACYNLENLPEELGSLKKLTHLDISECYMLEVMPKKLSSLTQLQVLKGFVVSDNGSSCHLVDLTAALKKLRKLSIYINKEKFLPGDLKAALSNLKELQNLKIAWGGGLEPTKADNTSDKAGRRYERKSSDAKKYKRLKTLEKREDGEKLEIPATKMVDLNKGNKEGSKKLVTIIEERQEIGSVNPVATNQDNKKQKTGAAKFMDLNEESKDGSKKSVTISQEERQEIGTVNPVATSRDNKKQETGAAKMMDLNKKNKEGSKKFVTISEEERMETGTVNPMATNQDKRLDSKEQETGGAASQPRAAALKRSISLLSRSFTSKRDATPSAADDFLPNLKKLDLKCFPQTRLPSWVAPNYLRSLNKLYIRHGSLTDLGQAEKVKDEWKVEILSLNYLGDLKLNWRELRILFPYLQYLDKVDCPKITFCPCDESGVWLKSSTGPPKQSRLYRP